MHHFGIVQILLQVAGRPLCLVRWTGVKPWDEGGIVAKSEFIVAVAVGVVQNEFSGIDFGAGQAGSCRGISGQAAVVVQRHKTSVLSPLFCAPNVVAVNGARHVGGIFAHVVGGALFNARFCAGAVAVGVRVALAAGEAVGAGQVCKSKEEVKGSVFHH